MRRWCADRRLQRLMVGVSVPEDGDLALRRAEDVRGLANAEDTEVGLVFYRERDRGGDKEASHANPTIGVY